MKSMKKAGRNVNHLKMSILRIFCIVIFLFMVVFEVSGETEKFTTGIYGMTAPSNYDLEKEFKKLKDTNIKMVLAFWNPGGVKTDEIEPVQKFFKAAEKYGIDVVIIPGTYANAGLTKDMAMVNAGGEYPTTYIFESRNGMYPCWNDPKQRELVKKHLEVIVELASKYSVFKGLDYDDEPSLGWYSKAGLACYCENCTKLFKDKYGMEPPKFSNKEVREKYPEGIVKDNDIWFKWNEFRTDTFKEYYTWCQKIVKDKNPNLVNTTQIAWSPALLMGLDYEKIWPPLDLVSVHCYPVSHPILTFALSTDVAYRFSRERGKDLWMMVQSFEQAPRFDGKQTAEPDMWREQVWLALSGGATGIINFPYDDGTAWAPFTRPELVKEMKKVYGELQKYGDVLKDGKKTKAKTAILLSYSTEAFDQMYLETPIEAWSQWHRLEEIHAAFLKTNIPVDIIFEDDILKRESIKYENIILINVDWLREKVAKKLENYAKNNNLYLDEECEISLKGSKKLNLKFNEWYEMCKGGKRDRRAIYPVINEKVKTIKELFIEKDLPVTTESKDIILRYLEGKNKIICFAINDSMKWPYTQDAEFTSKEIKGEKREAILKISRDYKKVYDLRKDELKKIDDGIVKEEIPSGDAVILSIEK